jgi:predicted CXXCH cytochrome family protein
MNPVLSRNAGNVKVAPLWVLAIAALIPAGALGQELALDVPLPPPPPGMKEVPLPPPPPGTRQVPAAVPASKSPAAPANPKSSASGPGERCMSCHSTVAQKPVIHPSLEKNDCTACHSAVTGQTGKCRSQSASKWTLKKQEPELCYDCHARKDQSKNVHTAVRQGSCLSCHSPHSSNFKGLLNEPPQTVCMTCHEVEPLITKAVRHAPVAEGRCLDCHNPHGSDAPFAIRTSGNAFCLKCHDSKAPTDHGSPGAAFRLDMSKPVVHAALNRGDCGQCHETGHSGDNLKLLKKAVVDTCYGCHPRKDKDKFPHSAVVVGDCAVCHAPHTSDQPKLLAKPTMNETCFQCHQDDVTMRKVIHPPLKKSCTECHGAHGAPNRNVLKAGEGKKQCYACHQPVDKGKNKHAALERYGCVGCHDPHGTAYGRLVPKKVNALCIGCHEHQKDGRHVTPLVAAGHVVGGDLLDPRRPNRDFTCASCHNPHGSDSPKLFYVGDSAMEMCSACHGDKSGKNPELRNVISKAKKPKATDGAAGGAGAGGAGAGGAGSGSGDTSSTNGANR